MRVAFLTLTLLACEKPVAEDAVGTIGQAVFETVDDTCRPTRFAGAVGSIFVGAQPNGRLAITSSYRAFWGPSRTDAGVIVSGSRNDFLNGTDVELTLGGDPSRPCARLRVRWTDLGLDDAGVRTFTLSQNWDRVDLGCPEQYPYLPEDDCISNRRVRFTPGDACRLQCVTPLADDVSCGC